MASKSNLPPLPPGDQYKATLQRQAIRKLKQGTGAGAIAVAVIEDAADTEEYRTSPVKNTLINKRVCGVVSNSVLLGL